MTRLSTILTCVLLLAGCAGGGPWVDLAQYDLGAPVPAHGADQLALGDVRVKAPPWLDTAAMQYRLDDGPATRRRSFAESRWVAPPAALLDQNLRQRFLAAAAPPGGCRLVLELDEFVQEFSGASASRATIEVRAVLLPARGAAPLARHGFAVAEAAKSADAAGGAAAYAGAAGALGDKIAAWLSGIATDQAAVRARCAGGD